MNQKRKQPSKAVRQQVYQMFDGRCAYCGQPIAYEDMQVDHVVPVVKGGANAVENYLPACRMCNFYKSTYTVEYLRKMLSKIPQELKKDIRFRLAVAYGLIKVTDRPVKFFFETFQKKKR